MCWLLSLRLPGTLEQFTGSNLNETLDHGGHFSQGSSQKTWKEQHPLITSSGWHLFAHRGMCVSASGAACLWRPGVSGASYWCVPSSEGSLCKITPKQPPIWRLYHLDMRPCNFSMAGKVCKVPSCGLLFTAFCKWGSWGSEKLRSATFQQWWSYRVAPIHEKCPRGAVSTQSQTPGLKS